METLPLFHIQVLQLLAGKYSSGCSLEEMTSFLAPVINSQKVSGGALCSGREFEATVLDALIVLNDKGHIFLNSGTDKSFITIKGMMAINSTVLCN
ncbi:hypothetical protein SD960_02500 [Flavobacterium sp. MMLR14_040]|uniref:hypothetical protein n=1 Tax=Flavobacterium sp. MMLR14_040 TaxID=3093843 RepID=UPI00298FCA46|nr:hypothetical protein [Flavobacterium sp. MMLR14_040]MDW8848949.1 hypothetical protein [Flavobacterium sp. MMLR14_040]